jgi:hypothetical protein
MKGILAVWMAILPLVSGAALAQAMGSDHLPAGALQRTCPDRLKLSNLCLMVGNKVPDEPGSNYKFAYQRKISEAACVDPSDSKEVARKKIQEMWRQYEGEMLCNAPSFIVPNGNILKLAVSSSFNQFLFQAAKMWQVDLNRVDETDHRTVLDYVEYELQREKGTVLERDLQAYYDMLRSAGAKRASEL